MPRNAFDYHTHNARCGHAVGTIAEYVEAAIGQGMQSVGVSDHNPAYFLPGDHPLPQTMMPLSELPNYVSEARAVQARYADQIQVRVGLEADYVEGKEAELAALLAPFDFDYVLGSVHWVFERSIFSPRRWDTEDAAATYAEYYRLVAKAARSGLFDILSHLSAVETYGPPLSPELQNAVYPPVVEAAKESGCIVEVNTSGFRKMGGDDPFPNRAFIDRLAAAGVPLTFGSDSHTPGEVGYGREKVAAYLTKIGVNKGGAQPRTVLRRPIDTWA